MLNLRHSVGVVVPAVVHSPPLSVSGMYTNVFISGVGVVVEVATVKLIALAVLTSGAHRSLVLRSGRSD